MLKRNIELNQLWCFSCFLLSFFMGGTVIGCSQKDNFERMISFDRNLINTTGAELVCQLSEDNILLKDIVEFIVLSDTTFVVMDGKGVYLYHTSGNFKKQFGNTGQGRGAMIAPSRVYATSDLVYIWCRSLMKFLIFDHEANLKNELSGFKRAVKKFVVEPSNNILYIYTSGIFKNTENKTIDVIDVYNIAEKTSKKYGERCPEDEVLSTWNNSGGFYGDMERLIYLHPGNLIIHDLYLNSDKTLRYKIDDKAFSTTKITSHVREIMENRPKLTDYLHNNSLVKDLYKDNCQFIVVAEIGQYDYDQRSRAMNQQKRKIKLYFLDVSFNPIRTILFDYISSPNIVIHSGAMYFLTLELGEKDQKILLNRFSLSEE